MTMTREDELAAAWVQFNARMILLTIGPKDLLCVVGHALRLLADLREPEGKTMLPLLVALRDAAQKTLAAVAKVQSRLTFPDPDDLAVAPSATDDAPETDENDTPEPPVWTEEWLECCAIAGPGAPGNLAPLTEMLLHYLSGAGAADDVLNLGQMQQVDEADQRLAKHLLDGFRGVLRKHLSSPARS